MHELDQVTFDWWANGNHHRAYGATRGFHERMRAYSIHKASTHDLIVGDIEERHTVPYSPEPMLGWYS